MENGRHYTALRSAEAYRTTYPLSSVGRAVGADANGRHGFESRSGLIIPPY